MPPSINRNSTRSDPAESRELLQFMPWPFFQSFEEGDLRAIYAYLKAIPCIAGPETGVLHNDCT